MKIDNLTLEKLAAYRAAWKEYMNCSVYDPRWDKVSSDLERAQMRLACQLDACVSTHEILAARVDNKD